MTRRAQAIARALATQYLHPADKQEVAQSLPLDPLALGAAESLAGDIEYRIHLIVQEAKKFMVAGKRSTLSPEDVEYAMEALNVEVGRVFSLHPGVQRAEGNATLLLRSRCGLNCWKSLKASFASTCT